MKVFALASLVGAITATNCVYNTNDHYVSHLPYFKVTETLPCQYAGTLPSNADSSHHMFYWMYTAAEQDAPVAIWLNGGPGASSTFANFLLNGPMRITKTGSSDNDYQVSLATEGSWVDSAHMVYVDQPVGTGFSWGEPLLTNMDEAAEEFVTFMENFYDLYPQFVGKQLYMTGESYGGKYLPRYSYALLQKNKLLDTTKYNLQATLIGDPYASPLSQRTRMHIVPEALNVLDDSNMAQIATMERRCEEMLAQNFAQADETCAQIMDYIEGVSGNVFPYDNRIFDYDWDPTEQVVTDYFTISLEVQKIYEAIHVDDSTKTPVFEMSSSAVGEAFVNDNLLDYSWYYEELIKEKSSILIYAGEFDAQDGPKTQETWLRRLQFEGSEDFWSQSRQIYYVAEADSGTDGYIVGGYWRTSSYFEYLTVPKAGHFVPANYYQPSYQFFSDYIQGQKLVCHKANESDCSVVDARCTFMSNCAGNGTCQSNGQCVCNPGYKGADCTMKAYGPSDDANNNLLDESIYGPMWKSVIVGANSGPIKISSGQPIDIFISSGVDSDPTQFSNEMQFKSQTSIVIDPSQLTSLQDGFSISIYVNAYDAPTNTLLTTQLTVQAQPKSAGPSGLDEFINTSVSYFLQ